MVVGGDTVASAPTPLAEPTAPSESLLPRRSQEETPAPDFSAEAIGSGEGGPRTQARRSALPRRSNPAAPQVAAAAVEVPAAPAASQSLLPKKARPAGRAELRRRQEAVLEPLDESPAVPLDRTPYLALDLRRVGLVSAVLLVVVILGVIFVH